MKTIDKPHNQRFHIEGVRHISPLDALEAFHRGDTTIIDVREIFEVEKESILLDDILFHPMSEIIDHLPFIPKELDIILVCPVGVRSTKVANLMNRHGYHSVANLDGGFVFWNAAGLPFRSNIKTRTGCACSCDTECDSSQISSCC